MLQTLLKIITAITLTSLPHAESQIPKYLVINYFNTPQLTLQGAIKNFTQKRNYYKTDKHPVNYFAAIFSFFREIASATSSSLITESFAKELKLQPQEYSDIYPSVWLFPGAPYTISDMLNKYPVRNLNLMPNPGNGLNFVYCDTPKIERSPPWDVSTLTDPFDKQIWLLLIISVLTITLTVQTRLKNQMQFLPTLLVVMCLIFPDAYELPKH